MPLTEETLQSVFSNAELGPCLKELQSGFQKVEIYQVCVTNFNSESSTVVFAVCGSFREVHFLFWSDSILHQAVVVFV